MRQLLSLAIMSAITIVGVVPIANSAPPAQKFRVVGTEPFWTLHVSQRGFVYHTPERKRKISNYVRPVAAQGRPLDSLRLYRMQGNHTLIISRGTCSDGMSDETYSYSAVLMMGSQVLAGCARPE